MITEKQQAKIRLLSDTEMYPQAVEFMHSIARRIAINANQWFAQRLAWQHLRPVAAICRASTHAHNMA